MLKKNSEFIILEIQRRVVTSKCRQPMQGFGVSPTWEGKGALLLSVVDRQPNAGPSQPTAYRLGWCWLLSCKGTA